MKPRTGEYEHWMEVPVRVFYRWFPANKNATENHELVPHIEIENVILPNRKKIEELLEQEKDAINQACLSEEEE